jgi:hypothetical protein
MAHNEALRLYESCVTLAKGLGVDPQSATPAKVDETGSFVTGFISANATVSASHQLVEKSLAKLFGGGPK